MDGSAGWSESFQSPWPYATRWVPGRRCSRAAARARSRWVRIVEAGRAGASAAVYQGSASSSSVASPDASRYRPTARTGQCTTSPWEGSIRKCSSPGRKPNACGQVPSGFWAAKTRRSRVRASACRSRASSSSSGPWVTSRVPQAPPVNCSRPRGDRKCTRASRTSQGRLTASGSTSAAVPTRTAVTADHQSPEGSGSVPSARSWTGRPGRAGPAGVDGDLDVEAGAGVGAQRHDGGAAAAAVVEQRAVVADGHGRAGAHRQGGGRQHHRDPVGPLVHLERPGWGGQRVVAGVEVQGEHHPPLRPGRDAHRQPHDVLVGWGGRPHLHDAAGVPALGVDDVHPPGTVEGHRERGRQVEQAPPVRHLHEHTHAVVAVQPEVAAHRRQDATVGGVAARQVRQRGPRHPARHGERTRVGDGRSRRYAGSCRGVAGCRPPWPGSPRARRPP